MSHRSKGAHRTRRLLLANLLAALALLTVTVVTLRALGLLPGILALLF